MAFISHLALPARTSLAPVCLPSCARRPRGSRCAAAPSASLSAPAAAGVAALAAAAALAVLPADAKALSFAAPRPAGLGVRSERYLASCPAGAKNCIGSLDDVYSKTYVPNWTYAQPLPDEKRTAKSMDQAVTDLLQVLGNYEGEKVEVVVNRPTKSDVGTGRYVYAEFATKTFGFVDDVEFLFNPDGKTVEYRSASRLGKSDLDANRKRIQKIRRSLMAIDNRWASTGY